MSYIMLPGMGELGAASVSKAQAEVDRWQKQIAQEKGKDRTNTIVLMVYQKNLKKAQKNLAEAKRAAAPKPSSGSGGGGMQNLMQSALNMVKPKPEQDPRQEFHQQVQQAESGPAVQQFMQDHPLPSPQPSPQTEPQDVSIATPPVDERITPPAQVQDRLIPEQTYVDIPPAEVIHTPGQGQKKGIDKRILIGGGLAAAGLVAVFALMD
jgi:hypothetical protein